MRLVRVGALVVSVVLIVATILSVLQSRSDARERVDGQVDSAAAITEASYDAAIDNASILAKVAAPDVDPADLRFYPDVQVCVMPDATAPCNGDDLAGSDGFELARERSAANGDVVSVADEASDTLLVVSDRGHVVAFGFTAETLVDPRGTQALVEYASEVDVSAQIIGYGGSPVHLDAQGRTIGVDRVSLLANPPDIGSVEIDYSSTSSVGLTGGNTAIYVALLALGLVLLLVAGWTYLSDRRSLERMATTDDLTGLASRREFARITELAMLDAERLGTGLCVMLIDLDAFKAINDARGHHTGDQVLSACAERLRSAVRDTDVVGRWGGDEFVVLLPGMESGSAVRSSAERIASTLSESPVVDDVNVSGSIGAAVFPRHGNTFEVLMRAADEAMYNAKTTGVAYRMADAIDLDRLPDLDGESSSERQSGRSREHAPT